MGCINGRWGMVTGLGVLGNLDMVYSDVDFWIWFIAMCFFMGIDSIGGNVGLAYGYVQAICCCVCRCLRANGMEGATDVVEP